MAMFIPQRHSLPWIREHHAMWNADLWEEAAGYTVYSGLRQIAPCFMHNVGLPSTMYSIRKETH